MEEGERERGREGERAHINWIIYSLLRRGSTHPPSHGEQWRASRASGKKYMALHSAGGGVLHTPQPRCVLPLMLAHLMNDKGASAHYKGALRRTTAAAWRAVVCRKVSDHIISYHIIYFIISCMYVICTV